MIKLVKKHNLLFAVLTICFTALIFGLVSATNENGKISITKSATKVNEVFDDENLTYGREALVKLNVNANAYTTQTVQNEKLDIVLVLDSSGSMGYGVNGKYDFKTTKRIESLKTEATNFVNVLLENENTKIGLVEFGADVKRKQELTNKKSTINNFINNLDAFGGTNLQSAINEAKNILDNGARSDAKQIVIILTDGIPTYYTYNNNLCGTGYDDSIAKADKCDGYRPSEKAKMELDSLKESYNQADVYTITFGNEKEAASTLSKINPVNENPLYANMEALDGDSLREKFTTIIENTNNIIGKNAIVTDIIPSDFKLTDESKEELINNGVEITNNTDGTTTLTWNLGDIETNNDKELSYIVKANDNYHGSMYTNKTATLECNVSENNPYYDTTDIKLTFDKPTVEIPSITKDDHYNSNDSYIGYPESIINGTSILDNDLNKNIKTDKKYEASNVDVTDKIVIIENENTVKNTNGTYNIYKDNVLQGILTINENGTFNFISKENISGEISFEYYIKTTINEHSETEYVYSNNSTVTLLIKEIEKISINGNKIWDDNNNQDGLRPNSIEVELYKNNSLFKIINITNDNWSYSFNDLYRYELGHENDDNYLIDYSIREKTCVNDYTTTYDGNNIINTHTPEITTINGTKTWDDNNNQDGFRPDEITINLFANGEFIKSTTANSNNNWKFSFENLDKYQNGEEINYTITENDVNGYTSEITDFDITNTHTPETISFKVSKVWNDSDNQDGIRPNEITVNLHANGEIIESQVISIDNNWTYTFENLDKYQNGILINYSIKEDEVNGYTSSISNLENIITITNTYPAATKSGLGFGCPIAYTNA